MQYNNSLRRVAASAERVVMQFTSKFTRLNLIRLMHYAKIGLCCSEIANILKVDSTTIRSWAQKVNIVLSIRRRGNQRKSISQLAPPPELEVEISLDELEEVADREFKEQPR